MCGSWKKKAIWGAAALVCLSGTASAVPFTFEFDLPDWTSESSTALFGSNAIVDVTVDNGAATDLNQAYMNSQIEDIVIKTKGGTFAHTWTEAVTGNAASDKATYITTMADGVATLDLLAVASLSGMTSITDTDGTWKVQFGTPIASSGSTTPFGVSSTISQAHISASINPMSGSTFTGFEVESVPEPLSASLFGIGLVAMGAMARRQTAGKQ